ncbi:MAG: 23S rRNA (adenine(2030)-N(6))-methyltransferase RlmJ [Treponema sp.]|nr:23S rRNA (adenine(2030)-N(6))-methyltransferase RlmJ [Treponema sp.]
MLSYEHIYHAGNHADILKHLTLTLILERLLQKDKPFTLYDTHAGFGVYDLTDVRAKKTNEAESGLRKVLAAAKDLDDKDSDSVAKIMAPYLGLCHTYAEEEKYPGSPEIARCLMREKDVLVLSELHPQAIEALRNNMKEPPLTCGQKGQSGTNYVKPKIHFRNGFEMLTVLTPPSTKRGCAIIDPSFEESADYSDCADTICAVHERWQNGIIALWYPLLEHRASETSRMKQQIISSAQAKQTEENLLDIQLAVQSPEEKTGLAKLYGSGMLVVNFPYQLDTQMEILLPWLTKILGNEHATWSIEKY